jgi:hypothetical protein
MELANSSVTMQFSAWIDQRESEWMRVRSEAIRTVKLALESAGLTLPSPGYVVQLQRERAEAPTLRPSLAPAGADKPPADVSVDRTLEKQIDAERSISGEADLLDAPGGGAMKGAVKPGGALPGPSRDP